MTMNGIDIASYQAGIDLTKVPCDFAVVKATQGVSYVNPDCCRAVQQCIDSGKPFGVYHYVGGNDAVAEANFFVDSTKNWIGKGVFVIDWESGDNRAWGNLSYLEALVAQVIARTNIPPMIYASRSVFPWDVAKKYNCGAWVAEYANNSPTGYQDTPWNEGAYSCAMRQYSSSGRLANWSGYLDLDKFYGSASDWAKYASGSGDATATVPETPSDPLAGKSDDELATEVINGVFGNGDARKQALGSRYAAVQAIVDQRLSAPSGITYTVRANDTLSSIASRFGVSIDAITGYSSGNPNLIYQGEVLTINGGSASTGQTAQTTYTIQSGDTLSGIAAKFNTTSQRLAEVNGIANPNLIYPGTVLKIQ